MIKKISLQVRQKRVECFHMTQQAFAFRLGISERTLKNIENEKCEPSQLTIFKLRMEGVID